MNSLRDKYLLYKVGIVNGKTEGVIYEN